MYPTHRCILLQCTLNYVLHLRKADQMENNDIFILSDTECATQDEDT